MGELAGMLKLKTPHAEALAAVVQARAQAERASLAAIYTCLVTQAAAVFGGNPHLALTGAGDRSSQLLRDVALYVMNTCFSFSQAQLAGVAGCVRYSVGRSISRIETAREDGVFNWKLEALEQLARRAMGDAA